MPTLSRLRRAPWLGGAVLLALAAGLVAPLALAVGLRGWPFYAGLGAGLILLFGAIERLWQRRPQARSRFVVLRGGVQTPPGRPPGGGRKGNGRGSPHAPPKTWN